MLVTLYTPDGQPWLVPQNDVREWLMKGYRRQNPVVAGGDSAVPTAEEELAPPPSRTNQIKVNTDPMSAIARLPGVGTATARAIRDNRPYESLEDLIEKVALPDGGNWTKLEAMISFE